MSQWINNPLPPFLTTPPGGKAVVVTPPPTVDYDALERIGRELLIALGEDPERDGLQDTPRRFASAWREFIEYDPGSCDTAFQSVTVDQMIIVAPLRVYSYCEHHLLPFWCDVSIGYIAASQILGLSKFARLAHKFAHRLQTQERLVSDLAAEIMRLAGTDDVAVLARGVHTCMMMRGIKTEGGMTTSVMHGKFRQSDSARAEFLQLIAGGK